jgi:hypothetical protein
MGEYVDASALGQVLLASVVGGIGLVVVFGLGLRGLSSAHKEGRISGYVLAGVSFAVVVAGIGFGLYTILAA